MNKLIIIHNNELYIILINLKDDPENSNGLPEDEFLLVLEHLG